MNPTVKRRLWITAASLLGFLAIAVIAGIVVAQTDWFREFVRQKVIQTVETSTGGKVEIGAFQFDWKHLRADIDRFVLHGTEPAGEDPLFSARKLTVELRLLSVFRQRKVDIASLAVDEPRVNFLIFPNGTTNVPNPAVKNPSDKSALKTIVDLAIGKFNVTNGNAKFNQQSVPFAAQGQNLQAALVYETVRKRYTGQLSTNPLFLQYAGGSRLDVAVNLPVVLEADRVELNGALLKTALSTLNISGMLQDLTSPKISVKAQGQVDIPEFAAALGQKVDLPQGGPPRLIDLNLDAATAQNRLQISTLKANWGQSSIDASGSFRNLALEDGSMDVKIHAALVEFAKLANTPGLRVEGSLDLQGMARTKSLSDYALDASLTGQGLSFRSGDTSIANAKLSSTISVDPTRILANPIHIEAAGGVLDGSAQVANLNQYKFSGNLSRFQLQDVLAAAGTKNSAWGATISGPVNVEGALKGEPLSVAKANLKLASNGRGVPLNGQLNAAYNGPSNSLDLAQSFVALPSSRVEFSGSLDNTSNSRIVARLTSQNLNDFLPAINVAAKEPLAQLPVSLQTGGSGTLDVTLTGNVRSPAIAGHLRLTRFEVEKRPFDLFNADLEAASNFVRVHDAVLARGPLQGQLQASVGLNNWKPTSTQAVSGSLQMQNADVLDVLALAGQQDIPVRGALTLNAQVAGTIGAPSGTATVNIVKGTAYDEPLDRVDGKISVAGQSVTLTSLEIVSNTASLNLNATFDHPVDDYTSGTLRGHVEGNQVALSRISALQKQRPGIDGAVQLNMDIEATLHPPSATPRVELVAANGTAGVRGLKYSGDDLGDAQARIQTAGMTVMFNLNSNLAGSTLQADGRTTIAPDYPTEANLNLQNLRIERIIKLAGMADTGAKGILSVRGAVSGTLQDPEGNVDVTLTQAQYAGQSIDRFQARINYQETLLNIPSLSIQQGPNQMTAVVSFKHPAGDFERGDIRANVKSNSIDLAKLAYVQQQRPGLAGNVDISVDVAGSFDKDRNQQPVTLSSLSAKVTAMNLKADSRDYGTLNLTADQAGNAVNLKFDSNVAQSSLQGTGQVRMAADYPITADVTLQNVHYSNWSGLISGNQNQLNNPDFDALVEGKLQVAGPMLQPTKLTGTADFAKVELYTVGRAVLGKKGPQIALRNDGPVTLAASQGAIEVKRARWLGPSTDVSLTGKVALQGAQNLDLTLKANANLELLQEFDHNIRSDGSVVVDATVKGTLQDPLIAGRMEMKDASYQTAGMLNGLSHANGSVILSGNGARIETLKAEVGGGDVTITGGATRSGGVIRLDLAARARTVRILSPVGASVVANANVKISGTSDDSLVSGTVNITTIAFNSRTDFGSLLSNAAPPKETPAGDQGLLDRMRLNINIRMGANTTFRTTFAEELEATADLTLRGTAGSPGMLGRVEVTQGELLFFGTKYSVHEGTVSFYNPNKIEPILDLNLATTARGVDVVVVVTGPIQNMNLSYQSDPPLQFSEIVGLLAAGKLPTSDPVLLAHQPATPAQSLPQMGASALVGSAVTNPLAGRLQRVFGVSQLKIDPTFTSGSELPQARLTLQQQITSDLTFTYVTNLARADPQIIRVEWVIDTDWSAIASRQENGMIGLDLFYKKRFQ